MGLDFAPNASRYIYTQVREDLAAHTDMTIYIAFETDDVGATIRNILSWGGSGSWNEDIYIESSTLRILHHSAASTANNGIWSVVLAANTFYQIAISKNWEAGATDAPIVYLNGVSVAVTEVQPPVSVSGYTADKLEVGNDGQKISELAFCSSILSASKMASISGSRLKKHVIDVMGSDIMHYYGFDEVPAGVDMTSFADDIVPNGDISTEWDSSSTVLHYQSLIADDTNRIYTATNAQVDTFDLETPSIGTGKIIIGYYFTLVGVGNTNGGSIIYQIYNGFEWLTSHSQSFSSSKATYNYGRNSNAADEEVVADMQLKITSSISTAKGNYSAAVYYFKVSIYEGYVVKDSINGLNLTSFYAYGLTNVPVGYLDSNMSSF